MASTYQTESIRSDFDRIAQLPPERWGHNSHYHSYLLKQLPPNCQEVIDVGCGTGDFARLLAQHAGSVVGIDFSPEMIRQANQNSRGLNNLRFVEADFMTFPIRDETVDAITTIATLHHVPSEPALRCLSRWLKPGGRLIVLDLFTSGYGRDLAWKLPAKTLSVILSALNNGRIRAPRESRIAWHQHAQSDRPLPLREIRQIADSVLPAAILKQHLFWRYSLVWTKPAHP